MNKQIAKQLLDLANKLDLKGKYAEADELGSIIKTAGDENMMNDLEMRLKVIEDRLPYTPPEHKDQLMREKYWTEAKLLELKKSQGPDEDEEGEQQEITDVIENWSIANGDRIAGTAAEKGNIITSPVAEVVDDVVVTRSGSRYKLGNPDRSHAIADLRMRLSENRS